jgi:uncharacterized protein (DUF362 family)
MMASKRWITRTTIMVLLVTAAIAGIVRRQPGPYPSTPMLIDAVSAATPASMSTVGLIGSDFQRLDAPVERDQELTVAQVEEMVREAVMMAGGLHQRLDADADWVVIKPNIVELKKRGSGVITDWRVARALVRMVHEVVPQARVTIAEGGAWIPPDRERELGDGAGSETGDGFAIAGYRDLLSDPELSAIDLDIVDLNFDETAIVQVPGGGLVFQEYHVPLTVLECDFLITVPVLKVIDAVGMTNAMKNFVGIAPGMKYGWPKMRGMPGAGVQGLPHMPGILDEVITDLTCLAEADFAVVDAIVGMERAKTDDDDQGKAVRLNTIVASPDIVAADAVSAMLIGFNPADLEYLSLAAHKGLGQNDPANIQINGSPIQELATRFEKPSDHGRYGDHGHYGQGCRLWLLAGPFERGQEQAGRESVDPRQPRALPGQNGWSTPVYFHDDKIDLDKYFDDPFNCVAYAYAEFHAPQDEPAEIWLGSDEGLRVWLNGEIAYDHQGARRHRLPNDRVRIALKMGWNTVLVRAEQSRGRYDFSLNMCEVMEDPRYDGNRVWGLDFTVPGLGDAGAAAPSRLEFAASQAREVSAAAVELQASTQYQGFDSLIGGLQACLALRGSELTAPQLQGLSGHAFKLCVGDSLERDYARWPDLAQPPELYRNLGFETQVVLGRTDAADFADQQTRAWELIKQTIDAGSPVVSHFGWSYRLVVGYDPRKETCLVEGRHGREPERMEIDQLGVGDHDLGLAIMALGQPREVDLRAARLASLRAAVTEAGRPDGPSGKRSFGFRAYQRWIDALQNNKVADRRGPALAAAMALESRTAAAAYLEDMAVDFGAGAAARLREAAAHYRRETVLLEQLTTLFPYRRRSSSQDEVMGQQDSDPAQLVREALSCERDAIAAIEAALQAMGPRG